MNMEFSLAILGVESILTKPPDIVNGTGACHSMLHEEESFKDKVFRPPTRDKVNLIANNLHWFLPNEVETEGMRKLAGDFEFIMGVGNGFFRVIFYIKDDRAKLLARYGHGNWPPVKVNLKTPNVEKGRFAHVCTEINLEQSVYRNGEKSPSGEAGSMNHELRIMPLRDVILPTESINLRAGTKDNQLDPGINSMNDIEEPVCANNRAPACLEVIITPDVMMEKSWNNLDDSPVAIVEVQRHAGASSARRLHENPVLESARTRIDNSSNFAVSASSKVKFQAESTQEGRQGA
ncbi:hypothetical protein SADUNF_Sadunf04G0125900 [Salix dunnii]|uniref:DUF4283 domain-containing protein n=1 Tax=Salix dunnii TaxID=1413687 RepID=A0A835K9M4_9ROSI|nr:hypothetical protein SADUNF_Sadunf04G0125900 [Salix dunnii]